MGDRYELILNCAHCGETNNDIWYAPTCGSFTFECEKCKKENFITSIHTVKKLEELTYEDAYDAVSMTSTMMNEEQIESYAREWYERLKKETKK